MRSAIVPITRKTPQCRSNRDTNGRLHSIEMLVLSCHLALKLKQTQDFAQAFPQPSEERMPVNLYYTGPYQGSV